MELVIWVLILSFILLLASNVPIAVSIAMSSFLAVAAIGVIDPINAVDPTIAIAERMSNGINSYALLAIPFFVLSGMLMGKGGLARRLMDFANALLGRLPGGLAYVNTLTCMLFGAISGSAAAAVSSVGGFMIPEMTKRNYSREFSVAVTTTAATTGLMIPPSNIMIVYAVSAGSVSVTALFMAGVIPGIITGLLIMLAAAGMAIRTQFAGKAQVKAWSVLAGVLLFALLLVALALFISPAAAYFPTVIAAGIYFLKKAIRLEKGYKRSIRIVKVCWLTFLVILFYFPAAAGGLAGSMGLIGMLFLLPFSDMLLIPVKKSTPREVKRELRRSTVGYAFFEAFWTLLLIVIVIGGMLSGFFTATEAAAVAVLYSFILAVFVYREVRLAELPGILLHTGKTTSMVMLLIGASQSMSWLLSTIQLPQMISAAMISMTSNPILILLLINLLLLFVGTFMDMTPAVLIFTPIFLPVVTKLGISPVHFGILMIANLCIGLCTPPVGTCLFIGCGVGKTTIARVTRSMIPFFLAMFISLMLITYIPDLSTALPKLLELID